MLAKDLIKLCCKFEGKSRLKILHELTSYLELMLSGTSLERVQNHRATEAFGNKN